MFSERSGQEGVEWFQTDIRIGAPGHFDAKGLTSMLSCCPGRVLETGYRKRRE